MIYRIHKIQQDLHLILQLEFGSYLSYFSFGYLIFLNVSIVKEYKLTYNNNKFYITTNLINKNLEKLFTFQQINSLVLLKYFI